MQKPEYKKGDIIEWLGEQFLILEVYSQDQGKVQEFFGKSFGEILTKFWFDFADDKAEVIGFMSQRKYKKLVGNIK